MPSTTRGLRRSFAAARPFPLDDFQQRALDLLDEGKSVLVAAPTGSGKTVVAEYAIAQALERGERAFYTTPLKALSNQKYQDLVALHGEEAVGLLTGDTSLNAGGRVVVMTTEVLRNMIYAGTGAIADLGCVILDEVHYLEDPYRGAVWEEIILTAPREVVLVCLSATVSNAEELAGWIHTVRGSTGAVIEEQRPIELRNLFVFGDRSAGGLQVLPTFVGGRPNPEAVRLDERRHRLGPPRSGRDARRSGGPETGERSGRVYRPRRPEVVERFADDDLLPAICFVFSRAGCDDAVRQCLDAGVRLTNAHERDEIREIVDSHVQALSDGDLAVLGYRRFLAAAEAGIAPHHAGMVPPLREAVEACFARALVKVVFATETLALGINMPARSVVIEQLSKFSGAGHSDLTPGEYTQLTGRAGRRGIDDVGYAAVLWSPFHSFSEVASLAGSRSRALRSSFRPTYNMAVNLVRRYPRDGAYRLVRSSFAQYLSERPLTHQLDSVIEVLEGRGYLKGWAVTDAGLRLAGIYHDCDLLLAEAMAADLLGGLDVPSLAAFVSLFVYEPRRAAPAGDLPTPKLLRRYFELEEIANGLSDDERAAGLPQTRAVDPGFARLAYEWSRGRELGELLAPARPQRSARSGAAPGRGRERGRAEPVMTGGDFVRNVKQLVDLLRQISGVSAGSRVGEVAARAAETLVRGIVAASSIVSGAPDDDLPEAELVVEVESESEPTD